MAKSKDEKEYYPREEKEVEYGEHIKQGPRGYFGRVEKGGAIYETAPHKTKAAAQKAYELLLKNLGKVSG